MRGLPLFYLYREYVMIELLITVLIALLILGVIYYLISMIPMPAPFPMLVRIVFIVICIIFVLWLFGPMLGDIRPMGRSYHSGMIDNVQTQVVRS